MKSVRLALTLIAVAFCSFPALAQIPGSIRTLDGSGAVTAVFSDRADVFLAPASASAPCQPADFLADGTYYFQVTDTTGQNLLSTDVAGDRAFSVRNGVLDTATPSPGTTPVQRHLTGPTTACGSRSVALGPFEDAGSRQAAYLVWITPASQFSGSNTAVDNACAAGCFHGFRPETSLLFSFRVEDKRNCQPTFCVSGVKFADANGNGVRDAGETGISGVQIRAEGESGPALTGLTGADGSFQICGLTDGGTFHVTEVAPLGYVQTGPLNRRISRRLLARDLGYFISVCDADFTGLDFGNQLIPNAIGGVKFEDLNANGLRDPGEPALSGVTVSLFPGTPAAPGVSRSVVTDANGGFLFTNVTPGPYFLIETTPAGFTQTTPASGFITVTSVAGGSSINNLFGNFRGILTGTISGTKFLDVNGNGVREAGETGQPGVTFTISGPIGFTPRTVVTGADGTFSFTAVPFGTYTVAETVPPGFRQTAPAAPGTATATVNVSTRTVSGLLFGNQAVLGASISGFKFIDVNGNGARDAGEPGGGGVTIRLSGPGGTGTGVQTTTASDGSFTFTGVAPGTYLVSEVVPVGFTQTAPGGAGIISVTVSSGETRAGLLFGNQVTGPGGTGTVSGLKILDLNSNGIVDGIDRPLEGIVFVLTASDGTSRQVTSGPDGTFRFDGVAPGNYVISEILPANFFQTFPGTSGAPQTYTVTVVSGQNAGGFLFLNKC
ncbi:MAG: SpaA isopeptide-forming pilin-related protein [Acidobacteriota bacterium]|nr:SpaA isopeptide-forming pilin-related protein [Acidobacteriota bacterium]